MTLSQIRKRADEVRVRPAADGNYYSVEQNAVRDRVVLLDMLDAIREAARRVIREADRDTDAFNDLRALTEGEK